jgi:hypothetical protein
MGKAIDSREFTRPINRKKSVNTRIQGKLDTAQDTKPQQVEVRSAEHDPGLSLQAIDLRFDLTIAPL